MRYKMKLERQKRNVMTEQKTLDKQRNYDTMSNMKDYMMWLDENGIATWDTTIGELIVPDSVDIYETELVERYKNDANWHRPGLDDDDKEEELFVKIFDLYSA